MLQVMAEGLFASDSCPFCEEKYGLDSVISVWGFFFGENVNFLACWQ